MAAWSIVRVLRVMLALVVALALLQPVLHARLLAPQVVVWFGLDGRALLWAGRGWLLAAAALPALLIGAIGLGALPRLGRQPGGAALERLWLWFGVVTAAFFAALTQLAFEANAAPAPVLAMGEMRWLAGSYALFVPLWGWKLRQAAR